MFNLRKIGVWGDSILKGVILDEVRGGYQLLAKSCVQLVEQKLGIPIVNKSKFGSTIEKGYTLLEKSLAAGLDCDVVMLEYGGNDCDFDWPAVAANPDLPQQPHTPLPLFLKTFQQMIDLLKSNGIRPILMSLPPISGERYLDFIVSHGPDRSQLLKFLGDANQIYRYHELYSLSVTRLALQNNVPCVPVREAFLARTHSLDLMCMDGIHPNEKGHQLMQQVITDWSQRALALA